MRIALAAATALALTCAPAHAQTAGEKALRDIYRERIEINTTASVGSCTAASEAMKKRLLAAGYPDSDLHIIVPPDHPREGNLVAVLPGSDASLKAVMLLAHIDVVEANRADWVRDPFKLTEENGTFYARGAEDDKAMAAVFVDSLVRFKQEKYKPKRTIKMALTCGEEGGFPITGAQYLVDNHRQLMDAAFALNEGASGKIDSKTGKYVYHGVQAGEKVYQDFTLEVTNPGGHSSRPVPDNAIYRLSTALKKVAAYRFPVNFNDATIGYFGRAADMAEPALAPDMRAVAKNPKQSDATDRLSKDAHMNALLRTTCVATQLAAGHAPNALPQRATGNVNCRIFPGEAIPDIKAALEKAIDDPQVKVTYRQDPQAPRDAPKLTPDILGPIERLTKEMFNVPVVPQMATGATDGSILTTAGIPTYGVSGMFEDDQLTNAHGLNESLPVKSLYEGREFLYRLTKIYAGGK